MRGKSKFSFLLVMLVIASMVLTACGGGKAPADGDSGGEDKAADDGKTYEIRIATVVTAPHPWTVMADYIKEELESKSDGKIKVSIFPGGQLGSDETTIDDMRLGTLDMVIGGTANSAPFMPEVQIFGLSYLFKDKESFESILVKGSPVYNKVDSYYKDKDLGLKLLALSGGGVRNVSNNKKPIESPADLEGMKMRITSSPIESKIWAALGVLPTSLPFNEVYSALQTGVADAFESTVGSYSSSKLYEVAPYHSKTEHQHMVSHVTMSEKKFNELPEEYQKLVEDVCEEAGKIGVKAGNEMEEEALKDLVENYGVKVNEVDKQPFIDAIKPLHEEIAKEIDAMDLLELCREANK